MPDPLAAPEPDVDRVPGAVVKHDRVGKCAARLGAGSTLALEGVGLYVLPVAALWGVIAGFVTVRRGDGNPGRGLVATKLLVTLRNQDEARTVHDSGMEILAE